MRDRDGHDHPLARGLAALDAIAPRDLFAALAAAVVGVGITHGIAMHDTPACVGDCTTTVELSTPVVVLLGVACAVLLLRRSLPRTVLVVIVALTTADAAAGRLAVAMVPALAVALATVIRRGDRRALWCAVAWAALVWLPLSFGISHFVAPVAWLIVIALAAEAIHTRRGRRVAQRQSREEAARRRAEEERLRIARELHDVLAHNISLISVQSGVALHLLDEHPEQARPALAIINEASGEALRELRSVLGVLRRVDDEAPRRPAAGLARLDELVAHAAAAGVRVQTRTTGVARPLPAAIDLAAYRIVQESLTNVARHAGDTDAMVTIACAPRQLRVEIADEGPRPGAAATGAGAGSGNGIVGMRERASALGGVLHAGPRDDGPGFRVRVELPLREAAT